MPDQIKSRYTAQPAMRVANVLFDDRFGGPQKRVIAVARHLKAQGIETLLILPCGSGGAGLEAKRNNVGVERIQFGRIPRPRDVGKVLTWLIRIPRDVYRFRKAYLRKNVNMVHVNGAFFVAPAIAAKISGLPLIWHLNDTIVPKRMARLFGVMVQFLADRCVVAAKAVANHYGVAEGRYSVLYAPVDIKEGDSTKEYRIEAGRAPRIGLIANWNPIKGLEYFVTGVSEASKRSGLLLDMVFAGGRPDTHRQYSLEIDALIDSLGLRDSVHDLGFVGDVSELMRTLDVLVLSSTSEACPMVVLEAMAAGVPVVASKVGGVPELLEDRTDGAAGIIVPPCDSNAIAEGILMLLREEGKRRAMGEVGYKRARAMFSTDYCVSGHLEVYRSVFREKYQNTDTARWLRKKE